MKPLPPVQPISLARHGIDRDHLTRGHDGDLSEIWASGARAVFEHRGTLLVAGGGLFLTDRELVPERQTEVYLGRDPQGTRYIGVSLDDDGRSHIDARLDASRARDASDQLTAPGEGIDSSEPVWLPLRHLAEALDDVQVSLACEIVGLGNWHRAHRFSPRTGTPTIPVLGGWVRRDRRPEANTFPVLILPSSSSSSTQMRTVSSVSSWATTQLGKLTGIRSWPDSSNRGRPSNTL